jgi:hypothetical protein
VADLVGSPQSVLPEWGLRAGWAAVAVVPEPESATAQDRSGGGGPPAGPAGMASRRVANDANDVIAALSVSSLPMPGGGTAKGLGRWLLESMNQWRR